MQIPDNEKWEMVQEIISHLVVDEEIAKNKEID